MADWGLDIGGFLADLQCFTLAEFDEQVHRLGRDAFLSRYNSAERPLSEESLRFYTAVALCERLARTETDAKCRAAEVRATLKSVLQ
jgi:hypothetical protein